MPATGPTTGSDVATGRLTEALLPPPGHFAAPRSTEPDTTSAPPPSQQVAQALSEPVKVVITAPPQAHAGPQILSIQLDPVELGKVVVRIERFADGPSRIDLVAERPDTLQRLVHDQSQLQQTLDQAGIPSSGRSLHFSLATDHPASSALAAGFTGDGSNAGGGAGGQRPHQFYPGTATPDSDPVDRSAQAASWTRTGLDITA